MYHENILEWLLVVSFFIFIFEGHPTKPGIRVGLRQVKEIGHRELT